MRRLKHRLNRPRLRALAARPLNGGPVYGCRGPGNDCVALSFDDGPSAANTAQLLELLEGYGARATFFVVGEELAAAPELARRAAEAGHELGNHTFSHPSPAELSDGELRDEIVRGTAAIEEAAGVTPTVARPPWGQGTRRFADIARSLDMRTVMWSIDSGDTWGYDAATVARFVGGARGGDIILMHDGGPERPATLGAIDHALASLAARRLRCITVSELLAAHSG
jgi:peptidoglycan/xylan/chitin deacetylase (PgdA/CDA1 family)